MVKSYLEDAALERTFHPKAIIAPHAGYIYSGPIAGSAYAALLPLRDAVRRVVLAGPSHRVAFQGIAVPETDEFETPLGRVTVDRDALTLLQSFPQVLVSDRAHAQEHSLEVHLPFLQEALRVFTIVPLVVGDASFEQVAEVFNALWGGPETIFVVSSDLSHYYDYATARTMDESTSRAIEQFDPGGVRFESACGRIPVNGLLLAARQHRLHATTVDLRNSGDTAGSREEVVGYGAYVFEP